MASFAELVREHLTIDVAGAAHLQRLISSWGLLADLSFSDLLLLAPTARPDELVLLGHVRPTTAQTIYRSDLVGDVFTAHDHSAAMRAWQTGEMVEGEHALIGVDEPARVLAVPVRHRGKVLAVLTREWVPQLGRTASDLERTYLAVFQRFARMIAAGS